MGRSVDRAIFLTYPTFTICMSEFEFGIESKEELPELQLK